MNPYEEPDRYYLSSERRRAVWHNEMNMFIVLTLPFIVAAVWYGGTIQMFDSTGRVIMPSAVGRGIGLALFLELSAVVIGAMYLFVQPAVVRVRNAQPVRGQRRLAYAAFDGLLVGLITAQSLPKIHVADDLATTAIAAVVGLLAALLAYASMLSMIDIPEEFASMPIPPEPRVRGAL